MLQRKRKTGVEVRVEHHCSEAACSLVRTAALRDFAAVEIQKRYQSKWSQPGFICRPMFRACLLYTSDAADE